MLCCLGCVTLPESLLKKQVDQEELTLAELGLLSRHPVTASDLLHSIPRLDTVANIIRWHHTPFHQELDRFSPDLREAIQILYLAMRFDQLEVVAECPLSALIELAKDDKPYSSGIVAALQTYIREERNAALETIPLSQLREGMILAENLCTSDGKLLMAKGYQISASALERIDNLLSHCLADAKVKVFARPGKSAEFNPVPHSISS